MNSKCASLVMICLISYHCYLFLSEAIFWHHSLKTTNPTDHCIRSNLITWPGQQEQVVLGHMMLLAEAEQQQHQANREHTAFAATKGKVKGMSPFLLVCACRLRCWLQPQSHRGREGGESRRPLMKGDGRPHRKALVASSLTTGSAEMLTLWQSISHHPAWIRAVWLNLWFEVLT